MSAVYQQYHSKGFEAVFAAVNANPDVQGFIDRFHVPFPVGVGDGDKARAFMQFTMVSATFVPWLVFIDRQGVIRGQYIGNDPLFAGGLPAIKAVVDKLLAEKPAPVPASKKAPAAK